MRKPLFNDPNRFGRIPDPPEYDEYCHNCRHDVREKQDTFCCGNEESEHYGEYTDYEDRCDLWEERIEL